MPENNLWKTFVDFVENFFQQYYPHTYQHQMWKTKLNVEKLWEIPKYKDINFCGKVKKNNITIVNIRLIDIFFCGKVCGKLFSKILIIYFIYVIVKSN